MADLSLSLLALTLALTLTLTLTLTLILTLTLTQLLDDASVGDMALENDQIIYLVKRWFDFEGLAFGFFWLF